MASFQLKHSPPRFAASCSLNFVHAGFFSAQALTSTPSDFMLPDCCACGHVEYQLSSDDANQMKQSFHERQNRLLAIPKAAEDM
jgi:hypothetical protein